MQHKEKCKWLGSVRSILWGKAELIIAEGYLQNCVDVHRVGADIITKKPLCDSEWFSQQLTSGLLLPSELDIVITISGLFNALTSRLRHLMRRLNALWKCGLYLEMTFTKNLQ